MLQISIQPLGEARQQGVPSGDHHRAVQRETHVGVAHSDAGRGQLAGPEHRVIEEALRQLESLRTKVLVVAVGELVVHGRNLGRGPFVVRRLQHLHRRHLEVLQQTLEHVLLPGRGQLFGQLARREPGVVALLDDVLGGDAVRRRQVDGLALQVLAALQRQVVTAEGGLDDGLAEDVAFLESGNKGGE